MKISKEAVDAATRALAEKFATNKPVNGRKDFTIDARAALAAALPHLECSCPHISEVNDYCPQHGRDS